MEEINPLVKFSLGFKTRMEAPASVLRPVKPVLISIR